MLRIALELADRIDLRASVARRLRAGRPARCRLVSGCGGSASPGRGQPGSRVRRHRPSDARPGVPGPRARGVPQSRPLLRRAASRPPLPRLPRSRSESRCRNGRCSSRCCATDPACSSARTSATSSPSACSWRRTASVRSRPVEEIEPPELFAFLARRRGGASVELVPLSRARKALSTELRAGGTVGIIGDRDLNGDGLPVTMFGHPTTMPLGPALLALTHRAGVVVGRCLRTGPDRFLADGEVVELPSTGNRRNDINVLTARLAARFERDIAEAPEQWWGAFQPFWPDLPAGH